MNYKYFRFEEVNSTNEYLKDVAVKDDEVAIAIAKVQTNGKGSKGRSFVSRKGGLYFSFKFSVNSTRNLDLITPYTALVVNKAIRNICQIDTRIKWINDIYYSEKKLCGILCESQNLNSIIIGIGINVDKIDSIPQELENKIGFIKEYSKKEFIDDDLINDIVNNFFENINFSRTKMIEEYKKYSIVLNKKVNVSCEDTSFIAKVIDIDENGNLIVIDSQNIKSSLNSSKYSIHIL